MDRSSVRLHGAILLTPVTKAEAAASDSVSFFGRFRLKIVS
jgi:hypothetical protein